MSAPRKERGPFELSVGELTIDGFVFEHGCATFRETTVGVSDLDGLSAALRERFGEWTILTWDREAYADVHRALERAGFGVHRRKVFVEKALAGYRSPYDDPFVYASLAELGRERFLELLLESAHGDPFEDSSDDPEAALEELVAHAGSAFRPERWKVAFHDDEPCGVVLPQPYADIEGEGHISYIGVRPAFRGRGWARILHAYGLAALAEEGIVRYVGSTDHRNVAMVRVFARNGCTQKDQQLFWTRSAS